MRRAPLPGRLLPTLSAVLALLLAACQPAAFVRPDVPVPERWPRQAATANAEAEQDAASLGALPWREILPAPELHALIEEALVANADLRIAIERIELARAQYGIERAALFPGVNATASATRERMPGFDPHENRVGENAVVGLSMPAWEIDLWGRLAARKAFLPRITLTTLLGFASTDLAQLFDSELAQSQIQRGLQQAVVQLYRALGGGAASTRG